MHLSAKRLASRVGASERKGSSNMALEVRSQLGARLALTALIVVVAWQMGGALQTANAGYTPGSTWSGYTYFDSSCSTLMDPVSVVFTFGNGAVHNPHDHWDISDHGDWFRHGGSTTQYFVEDGVCTAHEHSAATSRVFHDGWHARYVVDWTTLSGQSYAATPHWDDWDWPWGHCVRPPDGYTKARNEVKSKFTTSQHDHTSITNWWANTDPIEKCSGQLVAKTMGTFTTLI